MVEKIDKIVIEIIINIMFYVGLYLMFDLGVTGYLSYVTIFLFGYFLHKIHVSFLKFDSNFGFRKIFFKALNFIFSGAILVYVCIAINYFVNMTQAYIQCGSIKCFNIVSYIPRDLNLDIMTVGGFLITILGTYIAWKENISKEIRLLKG